MNIEITDKPALHPNMTWDEVPDYYKLLYEVFHANPGKVFLRFFAGFIFNETYSTEVPCESAFAVLDGRKSVIRELILTLKVLDGISQQRSHS